MSKLSKRLAPSKRLSSNLHRWAEWADGQDQRAESGGEPDAEGRVGEQGPAAGGGPQHGRLQAGERAAAGRERLAAGAAGRGGGGREEGADAAAGRGGGAGGDRGEDYLEWLRIISNY